MPNRELQYAVASTEFVSIALPPVNLTAVIVYIYILTVSTHFDSFGSFAVPNGCGTTSHTHTSLASKAATKLNYRGGMLLCHISQRLTTTCQKFL